MKTKPLTLGLALQARFGPTISSRACGCVRNSFLRQPNCASIFQQFKRLSTTQFFRAEDGKSNDGKSNDGKSDDGKSDDGKSDSASSLLSSPEKVKQSTDWKGLASNLTSSSKASNAIPSEGKPDPVKSIFDILNAGVGSSSASAKPTTSFGNSNKEKFLLGNDFYDKPTSGFSSVGIHIPDKDDRPPRIGPTAGRTVLVQGDVVQAFTRLRQIVGQNRVRQDLMKQRFHERPGLKRKRLKRERHRKRFKEAFKKMVGIVLDMKNRGM